MDEIVMLRKQIKQFESQTELMNNIVAAVRAWLAVECGPDSDAECYARQRMADLVGWED